MIIYGTALIAVCMLMGSLLGDVLGALTGVNANIGGVGFSMLLLLLLTNYVLPQDKMKPATKQGITFWQGMYIPVVVAMSASQNVVQALSSGPVAILAGLLAVAFGFSVLPLLCRLGAKKDASAGKEDAV